MPEDNKFLELSNEIEALKAQQEQNLEDYRSKLVLLDADVKALEAKKLALADEIKALGNKVDESKNAILTETGKASGIVSAAKAEAEAIAENAMTKANSLIELAEEMKVQAGKVLEANNSKIDDAIAREKQADETVRKADAYRLDAEIILVDANKKAQDAIKAKADADASIRTAEVKIKALEAYDAELNERFKAIKAEELLLYGKKQELADGLLALNVSRETFSLDRLAALADIEAKKAEIEKMRAGLIEQKERNKFKDAELESGFARLKKEQGELRKAQSVVDSMKKELSK
jgi:hypothetical protein